jgi:4-amino-4-deoxy-L-arabinose transferase-like glycosyltransferase
MPLWLRMSEYKRGLFAAWLLAALLWGVNFVWLKFDTRPPLWDMALHQTYALNYLDGSPSPPEPGIRIRDLSGNYPPFVHLVIAFFFFVLHPGPHVAVLANLPATFLLFWGIYQLGYDLSGSGCGKWACILAALTPYLIWLSRETILDYWLSAWVASSLALLYRTKGFESRPASLALGCSMALGMLTKWFFVAFLFLPLFYVVAKFRVWKRASRRINFCDTLLIAGIGAGIWYLPNLPKLVRYFSENAQIGAREGEPPALSFQSIIYYLRLLEGYQFFAILFVLLLASCFFVWKKRLLNEPMFLISAIIGGWFVMTMLRTKDPRFTMPLLGLLTIFPGAWIQSWKTSRPAMAAKVALLVLLAFQAYAANFGVASLPRSVILARGYQGSVRWDWNLYLQDCFGVCGRPRLEDWKQAEILRELQTHSADKKISPSLALVPDLPYFNSANFQLQARMAGMRSTIDHLQSSSRGVRSFDGFNYVLTTEGDQGMSWTTGSSRSLNQIIADEPKSFCLLAQYPLPNGDHARLYFVQHEENPDG